jgi:PEP-CTERM motif
MKARTLKLTTVRGTRAGIFGSSHEISTLFPFAQVLGGNMKSLIVVLLLTASAFADSIPAVDFANVLCQGNMNSNYECNSTPNKYGKAAFQIVDWGGDPAHLTLSLGNIPRLYANVFDTSFSNNILTGDFSGTALIVKGHIEYLYDVAGTFTVDWAANWTGKPNLTTAQLDITSLTDGRAIATVPEPSSLFLLTTGLVGIVCRFRSKVNRRGQS